MRKWILVVIATVMAAAILFIGGLRDDRAAPVPWRSPGPATAPRASGSRPVAGAELPEPGLDRLHRLDFRMGIGNVSGGLDLRLSGDWHTTVVDDDHRTVLRFELVRARLERSDQPTPPDTAQELGRPWFVELDEDGRIDAAWFEPEVGRGARDLLKSVAAYLQLCLPAAGDCTREEQDSTGTYQASYVRAGPDRITRTKQRYLHVMTAHGIVDAASAGGPDVRTSQTEIELDGEGWPAHTTVEETLAASLADQKDAFTARVSLHAELVAAARRADLAATFAASRSSLRRYAPLAEAPDAIATAHELDRQLVSGADIGQLLGELRAARDEHDESALLRRLRAMFALEPGTAAAAGAALRSGALPGGKARTLIAALTASGTAEAQKVVLDFLQGTTDPGLRLQALGSLGLTPAPTPETVRTLAELADSGTDQGDRSTALLALGSTGRTAPEAVDRLMERLSAARTSEEQRLALRALGNSGDQRALPAIREALASKDPVVRDAAVAALRAIDGPEADALIIRVLAGDPDPGVRGEAVFAASFRPIQVVLPALASALKSDRDPTVRLRAVKALALHRADTAAVAALLDWVQANDPDETVRQATQQPGGYAM